MAEKRYIKFIEKLIEETKKTNLKWDYLDSNKPLCYSMNWAGGNVLTTMAVALSGNTDTVFRFDKENSFCCKIRDNYVVLFVEDSNPATLYVIPPTFRSIVQLTPDEYGEYVTRLFNLVQSQFPSADAFIDSFLEPSKEDIREFLEEK